jgi:hypothetical protein
MSSMFSDFVEFDKGYFWRRVSSRMEIVYPIHQPFKLPEGYRIDVARMPVTLDQEETIRRWSYQTQSSALSVSVPILGWTAFDQVQVEAEKQTGEKEVVYFVDGLEDSHNIAKSGEITIPVSGQYIYQIKGMPVVKSKFKAGDVIEYPVTVLFRTGN